MLVRLALSTAVHMAAGVAVGLLAYAACRKSPGHRGDVTGEPPSPAASTVPEDAPADRA